ELAVEGSGALARRIEGPLESVDCLIERILAALIGLTALVYGLLGESTHALGHGRIELERLEFLGGFAEGFASGLGGGDLGGLGGGHDRNLCLDGFTGVRGLPLRERGAANSLYSSCCTAI